jgi:hypothetical protein
MRAHSAIRGTDFAHRFLREIEQAIERISEEPGRGQPFFTFLK